MERGISQVQRTKSLYALLLARLHSASHLPIHRQHSGGGSKYK